ncbi:MAG: thioredoxin domain-containing protein [Cyanobacteriota bacterium]|nr:thioredoxin domain-containing protein [Cyanobacteriota bacterium]
MAPTPPPDASLGRRERMMLAALAALLAVALLWLRGGISAEAPLDALARRSPDPATALASGKPTVVEFYADWCEACRAMAPAMVDLERRSHDQLNVVLLNVDNPRWQPDLERYGVNGIPHLELFNSGGTSVGHAIGARTAPELGALSTALITDQPLPVLAGVGATSSLSEQPAPDGNRATSSTGPRSHG